MPVFNCFSYGLNVSSLLLSIHFWKGLVINESFSFMNIFENFISAPSTELKASSVWEPIWEPKLAPKSSLYCSGFQTSFFTYLAKKLPFLHVLSFQSLYWHHIFVKNQAHKVKSSQKCQGAKNRDFGPFWTKNGLTTYFQLQFKHV